MRYLSSVEFRSMQRQALETIGTNWKALFACFLVVVIMRMEILPAYSGEPRVIEVAVFDDRGVGPCFKGLVEILRRHSDIIHMTVLNGEDIRERGLKRFDVFMAPGGSGRKQTHSLEANGAAEVKRFVRDGGCYVGTCAGCYMASDAPGYLGLLPVGIRDQKHWHRGKATLPIEYTKAGSEVFGVSQPMARIVYHNGPVLDCRRASEDRELGENLVPLSFYRGEVVAPGGEVGVMKGAPAMVLSRYGKGLVLGMSPHPELTPTLHRTIPHALRWLVANVNKPGAAEALVEQSAREPHAAN